MKDEHGNGGMSQEPLIGWRRAQRMLPRNNRTGSHSEDLYVLPRQSNRTAGVTQRHLSNATPPFLAWRGNK